MREKQRKTVRKRDKGKGREGKKRKRTGRKKGRKKEGRREGGKKGKKEGRKERKKEGRIMTDPQLAVLVPHLLVAACLVALLPGSGAAEQKKLNPFCHKDALSSWARLCDGPARAQVFIPFC